MQDKEQAGHKDKRRLSSRISVRFSSDEAETLIDAAQSRGETISAFIRRALLDHQAQLADGRESGAAPLPATLYFHPDRLTTSTCPCALVQIGGGAVLTRTECCGCL